MARAKEGMVPSSSLSKLEAPPFVTTCVQPSHSRVLTQIAIPGKETKNSQHSRELGCVGVRWREALDCEAVFQHAEQGDAYAQELVRETARPQGP